MANGTVVQSGESDTAVLAPPRTGSAPSRDEKWDSSRLVVLVVDDNEDARELMAVCLPRFGLHVETARDGYEAVEKARALQPDVIVMDLAMPTLSGDSATIMLKSDERTRAIPVIALSAHGFVGRSRARAAGCDAFRAKPCLPDELVRLIDSLLLRRRSQSPPFVE